MILPTTTALIAMYHELQTIFAVIFGMFIQFIFGNKKSLRIFTLIIISSLFVAIYLVPMFVDLINLIFKTEIKHDSKIAVAMYALSSLLSMEIIAMFITFLPDTISKKVKKYLGVDK